MAKTGRQNKTEGTLGRLSGRVRETVGKLTGSTSTKAKGKTSRARGSARAGKGKAKRAARR